MANKLFNDLGGNDRGFAAMMQQFRAFSNGYMGDARAEVQKLLQSGQMTQEQYNQLGQMASRMLQLK